MERHPTRPAPAEPLRGENLGGYAFAKRDGLGGFAPPGPRRGVKPRRFEDSNRMPAVPLDLDLDYGGWSDMKAIAVLALLCSLIVPSNQALLLPGSPADYAQVADSASLSNLPELTSEAWIFPAVAGSQSNGIDVVVAQYSSAQSVGPFSLSYYRDIQRMRPIVNWNLPGFSFFDGNAVVPLGKWTHVAMTYGGGFLRLYVNGVLDKEAAVSTSSGIGEIQLPYRIGTQTGASYNPFVGLIDEVRLWNVVRTEEQISDSLAGLAPGDDEGLVAYWRMQDPTTSSVLLDSSAFGNHAHLFGAARTNVADVVPKLASKVIVPHSQPVEAGDPTVP